MMSKPAIALYLGESYATMALFDVADKSSPRRLFEKSVFLPQVSFKNLTTQMKAKHAEFFPEAGAPTDIFVVTKYLDRLKQFRLGGSISQVILKGFENSYHLADSKTLSLAAAQLIIPVEESKLDEKFLAQELERIKKINPDVNKVVISLPEETIPAASLELLHRFFEAAEMKIFMCPSGHNQSQLRKTLLNAGSEGTKEEIVTDLRDAFGTDSRIFFFGREGFAQQPENCELFTCANNFFAHFIKSRGYSYGAYFDIESAKFIAHHRGHEWASPWGSIPLDHFAQTDLSVHPFSEVKLNHISILQTDSGVSQLEPGPVVAGRAIKPLMLDLFYEELLKNDFCCTLFSQQAQENIKNKLKNIFSVLEKSQKNPVLSVSVTELKKIILETFRNEIAFHSGREKTLMFGPLKDVFAPESAQPSCTFSWSDEIIKAGALI